MSHEQQIQNELRDFHPGAQFWDMIRRDFPSPKDQLGVLKTLRKESLAREELRAERGLCVPN